MLRETEGIVVAVRKWREAELLRFKRWQQEQAQLAAAQEEARMRREAEDAADPARLEREKATAEAKKQMQQRLQMLSLTILISVSIVGSGVLMWDAYMLPYAKIHGIPSHVMLWVTLALYALTLLLVYVLHASTVAWRRREEEERIKR